jgi:hypothetical protein
MAEEIITALSRCPWLFVIVRNSSFTYKGRPVDTAGSGANLEFGADQYPESPEVNHRTAARPAQASL